jgi:hypothetical protein
LRSNTKGYGGKTHGTGSQNSDTTALSGRELYNLQFSLKAVSPETFGHTLEMKNLKVGGTTTAEGPCKDLPETTENIQHNGGIMN